MKLGVSLILTSVLIVLSACSTAPKNMRDLAVKRAGVLNLYQDLPSYTKLGLTNDVIIHAELPEMRDYLTNRFIAALGKSGIQAQPVRDHLPLLRNQVDVILELQPQPRIQFNSEAGEHYEDEVIDDGSNGMGVYYKSLLLSHVGPESFVSIRVVAVKNQAGELVPAADYHVYVRDKINLEQISNSWSQLSDSEKTEIRVSLQRAIDDSVAQLMTQMEPGGGGGPGGPGGPPPR